LHPSLFIFSSVWISIFVFIWSNWWPTFVIIFYVLCPIPLAIGRYCTSHDSYSIGDRSPCLDLMWFITSAIVVSAFCLPAVLFRANVVSLFEISYLMILLFLQKNLDSRWFNGFCYGSQCTYIYYNFNLFCRIWFRRWFIKYLNDKTSNHNHIKRR
jgi:hypothetical protein